MTESAAVPAVRDPSIDILRQDSRSLRALFQPRSVAVIGATDREGSVGRTLFWNLMRFPFGASIYPIHPTRKNVLGVRAYPAIEAVPESVDLAIIATPAHTVPAMVDACASAGVKSVIVISAGFREAGPDGLNLEAAIRDRLATSPMRMVGPNCLGVMSPHHGGMNASFSEVTARPGHVAFLSQSGAICTSVLDWAQNEQVGFSAFVSVGSMLDVDWGDLIRYFGDDPKTRSIVIYMEAINDAQGFLSAAREVAKTKPIVVIKGGRTEAAAAAAASHTGALAGSDAVLDAALCRAGVLRVDTLGELFGVSEVLAKQPALPRGSRLGIITNAGGPGVLATDALIRAGGALAELSDATQEALNRVLPGHWSHGNPVDVLGDANPERYARAFEIMARDPNADGLLVILTPQSMTRPTEVAERIRDLAHDLKKPVLACWMGGSQINNGMRILNAAGIPTYPYPDKAARLFRLMAQYRRNLEGLYETPVAFDAGRAVTRTHAASLIQGVREDGRFLLTEAESKEVLTAYGIPVVVTQVALSAEDAVATADTLGYPAVLKLHSNSITHKSDVGGVRLNLHDATAVRDAFTAIRASVEQGPGLAHFGGVTVQPMIDRDAGIELILGGSPDPQFGPVVLFGSGGTAVEVFRDSAIALPPLTSTLAQRLVDRTRVSEVLAGTRGRSSVDAVALQQLMIRFAQLLVDHPEIREIDINPLLAFPSGQGPHDLLALDARIVLYRDAAMMAGAAPPAIRPYPNQYASPHYLGDGREVLVRPIRPEDEPLLVAFHESLSEESVYLRYFSLLKLSQRVAHDRLTRICFADYNQEMALVAEYRDRDTLARSILGVARLSRIRGTRDAEFSMLIRDADQRQGLGSELLQRLVHVAQREGITRIVAEILPENTGMRRICRSLGFTLSEENGIIEAELVISEEIAPPVLRRAG